MMGANKTIERQRQLFPIFLFVLISSSLFIVGDIQASEPSDSNDFPSTTVSITHPYVFDEVIVLFRENINSVKANDLDVRGNGNKINGKILKKYFAGKKKTLLRVKLSAGQNVESVLAENWSQKDPRILRVEPNYRVYAMGISNDTYFSYQWGLHNTGQTRGTNDGDIDAPEAWNITTGSSNVVVAVIDSGVNYVHPDLRNQIWTNIREIPGNGIDDDGNGYVDDYYGYDFSQKDSDPNDENGHGTHCAGIIAAEGNNSIGVSGVNWRCRIMPCRFLDASGSGTVADAIEAINYAVENGANVLSNSWGGGGYSEALKAAIENAKEHNVLFVAAAGNSATDNDASPTYPSSYLVSNVVSVAATDHLDQLAYFSCYGKQSVHVSAPGVNILSTLPGGYGWCSGTSMATPFVSGTAALLLSAYPGISVAELKNRLIWSGDILPELEGKTLTGRRLNAYKALTAENILELSAPADGVRWVVGFNYEIQWISIGGAATINLYLEKDGYTIEPIAENVPNEGCYSWKIPSDLSAGTDYSIRIEDGTLSVRSQAFSIAEKGYDYYTESFLSSEHPFDLAYKSVLFVPAEGGAYYALEQDISSLPTDPAGGKRIKLQDDDAAEIILCNTSVVFDETSYSSFYVGSNGYVTFDQADTEYSASLRNHFGKKRISAFFRDLNPAAGGQVSVKETTDRVAVTWDSVPKFNSTTVYTFQLELYYNGKIRLSWLDIRSAVAVVGFSNGLGIASDFLDSDMSGYATYEPALLSLKITGNDSIKENNSLQLLCTGYYEDGIVRDLSENQDILWNAVPSDAMINASGTLYVGDVDILHHVDVIAQDEGVTDHFGVFVKGENVSDIRIDKCSVAAWQAVGRDCLSLSGAMSLTEDTIRQAETIRVKLYSNENVCVFESIYNVNGESIKNGVCSVKKSVSGGSGGRTEQLRIDSRNNIFRFGIRNVSLKGLSCPFYFTLECGTFTGAGQIQEGVVNGKRLAPMELMNEVENKLRVDTIQMVVGDKARSVSGIVKGCFSLRDNISSPGNVVLTWNSKVFMFPINQAAAKNGVFVYRNVQTENGLLSGKIDLKKNTFTLYVKNTDISPDVDRITVELSFDTFDESLAVEL
jgi:subtilisin family serine protease